MKNTNFCPKCQSEHIVFVKGTELAKTNQIPTGMFSAARVDRYVCAACGYMKEWVNMRDMEDLVKYYKD